MRLVVVSAGLSVPSSTRLLADRLAAAVGRQAPADVRVVELRELAVEIAHHLTNGFPGRNLAAALEAVTDADALIAVTPVFSASYSGLFKSFFDVLDRDALTGTPVLIAATGGSARHSLVLEHALRPLFAHLRALIVPTGVYAASEDWGAEGLDGRIERAAGELAALTRALPAGRRAGDGSPAGDGVPAVRPAGDGVPAGGPVGDGFRAVRPAGGGLAVVPFAQQLAALSPTGAAGAAGAAGAPGAPGAGTTRARR
ncbi:FMN reductase [Streptomyces sp. H51]|uniref:FMN reductase n=1 Tax=Streptomyces sp. H51 TaxID=3111770 RepID=UPI002D7942F1|nr:FMN reductase [Streptomyces sp. H51]